MSNKWFVDDFDPESDDPEFFCIGEFDTKEAAEAFAKSRSRPSRPNGKGGIYCAFTPVVFLADPAMIRVRDAGRILQNAMRAK